MDSQTKSYIEPIPCKNKEIYSELNNLIFEYLEVNGLEQALQTFSKECHTKNLPCRRLVSGTREVKATFTHYDGELLLKSFDEGELEIFLKLWKLFQTHIQVTSEDMKKLEVYLRVHFAIWPKAHKQSEAKQSQAMQALKAFFEEHSASLSSDATILPLFALPFVPDPRPHPIFKDLFHESWTTKLRAQLETTVNKYFELLQENITAHCKLASVVKNSRLHSAHLISSTHLTKTTPTSPAKKAIPNSKGANNPAKSDPTVIKKTESAVVYHQDRFFQLMGIHRKTRKAIRGLRESYGKLLKVCSELLVALEKSVVEKDNTVRLDLVMHQCFLIFPEIFTNPDSTTNKPDLVHFKKVATTSTFFDQPADSDVSIMFLGILDMGPEALNFEKIRDTLMSEKISLTEKLCLMQALRWMLTKTTPECRNHVVESFVSKDILGIKSSKQELRHKLFSCLLSPNPTYQKESLARLINAFASTWAGRTYLTSSDYVIDILIKSLSTFKSQTESFICHMVIATLQKLSLRKSMRRTMIDQNVIPWLVRYIKLELDRDIIRDEVQQMANDWRNSGASSSSVALEGNEKLTTVENETTASSSSNFYGDSFNKYLMEYAWALLMNLCLHDESMKSCMSVDFEFLHCIIMMLTSKSSFEFTPYVLSTLFSLLRNPEMFEKAKTMNLDKKLGPMVEQQSGEIATHLRHLLSQLYEKENVDRLTASGETDYDDTDNPDPDEVETELELPESWTNNQTETLITGDDLLIREYLIQKELPFVPAPASTDVDDNQNPINASSNSVDSPVTGLILRPITPTRTSSKNPRSTNNRNNNSNPVASNQQPQAPNNQQEDFLKNPPSTVTATLQNRPQAKLSDGKNKKPFHLKRNPLLHPDLSMNPLLQPDQQLDLREGLPQLQLVPLSIPVPIIHTTNSEKTDSSCTSFLLHDSPAITFPTDMKLLQDKTPTLLPLLPFTDR